MSRDPVVTPEGWLHRGAAFVRGDGVQLAVFGGIPGERARVKLVGSHGNQDHAKWLSAAGKPHPDRVSPSCDRYVPCGRCPLMHLTDAGQDRMRLELVNEALAEVGLTARVSAVVHDGAADTVHTLELRTGFSDQKHARIGVRAQDGRDIVPIPGCVVVTPSLREVMKVAAHHMRDLEIWPYDGRKGTLRAIYARESAVDGTVLVLLVVARPSPILSEYAQRLASAHPPIRGVVMHLNDLPDTLIDRDDDGDIGISVLYGSAFLPLAVGDLRLKLSASDSYPPHPRMRARIAADVVAALGVAEGDAVLELGAEEGAITMVAAATSGWALGVVEGEGVARRARENAAANGVAAEFVSGAPLDALEAVRDRVEGRRPLLVATAGTRGLLPGVMDAIVALNPRKIALRGANPRSLAKNLAALTGRGFTLAGVSAYDVAPNTPFVELVATLVSTDTTAPTRRAPRRKTLRG